jgi:Di-haem oxidoreductase, putative peroxidase
VRFAAVMVLVAVVPCPARGQLAVRPDDPLGLAARVPRVRVIHSATPELAGSSMWLQQADPWHAYVRGRALFFREWATADGVFGHLAPRAEAGATNSCGMCHNLPFPSPGRGGTTAGAGRIAPHLAGAGLVETLGIQIRAQLLAAYDTNHNGYLDVPAETRGRRARVVASPGVVVDFGSLDDADGSGLPDLDPVVMVRTVDDTGQRTDFDAEGHILDLRSKGVRGYDLALGVFSRSIGDHQFTSLRVFASGALATVFGILPEGSVAPGPGAGPLLAGRWGRRSNANAFLTEVAVPSDPGHDPAHPRAGTISEGELDLLEWYLLNSPAPALGHQDDATRRGRALLDQLGCTTCHVARWDIASADDQLGLPGDRRFFDLAVTYNERAQRLEGRLHTLTRDAVAADGTRLAIPRRDKFTVDNLFSDFKHHDLGPRFWEYQRLGERIFVLKRFRTAPLWGIGSADAFGHDGRSRSLDEVIRRHGGEADAAARAWSAATPADRANVIVFLQSLVLYVPELLPADLDGDGMSGAVFRVAGRAVGPELFRPEYLCLRTPRYRGWITGPDGRWFSWALQNVRDVYGLDLPGLADRDGDGLPDVLVGRSER